MSKIKPNAAVSWLRGLETGTANPEFFVRPGDVADTIETLKRENADLTRRLAEVTAERDTAVASRLDWVNSCATMTKRLVAAENGAIKAERERIEAEAMLAHAESERDTAYKEASERYKAFVALEAALSRRDEALRVAREAIDKLAGLMTAAEAAVLVPHQVPDFEGGYDRCVARARDAQDALNALTKPQEATDAGENG